MYRDLDKPDLDGKKVSSVHAFCFCGDKFVIVYAASKGYWTPPGGAVEIGEGVPDAIVREVKEETNMKVVRQQIIGTQDIFEKDQVLTQVRAVCLVEPYGEFLHDPDDGEMKLIDPEDYKKYFNWGEIGEHLMRRALEVKKELEH